MTARRSIGSLRGLHQALDHPELDPSQAGDQVLERLGMGLHRCGPVGQPRQGRRVRQRSSFPGGLERLGDDRPPRLGGGHPVAAHGSETGGPDERDLRQGAQGLAVAACRVAARVARLLRAAAGLAQHEGRAGVVDAGRRVVATQSGQQEGHRGLPHAVVVCVHSREPGCDACPGVDVVEAHDRLVARQHEACGPQRPLEADGVAVGRGDHRRGGSVEREHARGGVLTALLVVVGGVVDPGVGRGKTVRLHGLAVRPEPFAHVALGSAADETDRGVPVPDQVLDGGPDAPRVVGSHDRLVLGLRFLADHDDGDAPVAHGGAAFRTQRVADDHESVDGGERHGGLEDGAVRIALAIEAGWVGLDGDDAVAGGPGGARDTRDDGTEVEPADDRREHADRASGRRRNLTAPGHC